MIFIQRGQLIDFLLFVNYEFIGLYCKPIFVFPNITEVSVKRLGWLSISPLTSLSRIGIPAAVTKKYNILLHGIYSKIRL